jgi:RNA polymerase sigma factor (sigma-70 family)
MNGNREAQEVFYKKYQKTVKDYLKHSFPKYSVDDIDDCVSSILIKVFDSLHLYDSEKSSVKTWILSIAKHYMIDLNRKNSTKLTSFANTITTTDTAFTDYQTTTSVCNTAFLSNAISSYQTFTTCSTDFENCSSIKYITSQLTPQEYTLLDMKYVQGYNYNEIGKEFQLTSSTVSNKINYIKTKLKKNIQEEIYD